MKGFFDLYRSLYFIRDKDKLEVDFLVIRNEKSWLLVEVKTAATAKFSRHLSTFQENTIHRSGQNLSLATICISIALYSGV